MTDKQITLADFAHPVPVGATIPTGVAFAWSRKPADRPQHVAIFPTDLTVKAGDTETHWTAAPIPAPMTRRERLAEVMVDAQRLYYGEQSMPLADLPPDAREAWLRCAAAALAFLGAEGDNQ